MTESNENVYRQRLDFSKIKTSIPVPNLINIQKASYQKFLQMDLLPSERTDSGLKSVFESLSPSMTLKKPVPWNLWTSPWAPGNANADVCRASTTTAPVASPATT